MSVIRHDSNANPIFRLQIPPTRCWAIKPSLLSNIKTHFYPSSICISRSLSSCFAFLSPYQSPIGLWPTAVTYQNKLRIGRNFQSNQYNCKLKVLGSNPPVVNRHRHTHETKNNSGQLEVKKTLKWNQLVDDPRGGAEQAQVSSESSPFPTKKYLKHFYYIFTENIKILTDTKLKLILMRPFSPSLSLFSPLSNPLNYHIF